MATLAKLQVELGFIDNFSDKLAGAGQKLTSVGRTMTMGLTLPILAVGAASVKMASDLAESTSLADQVFGTSATTIQNWSKTMASSFGVSRNDALTFASTIGLLLTNMGFTDDAAAGMSMQMVQLAADMASAKNVPVAEALEAIRSGLVGETEPLRNFGVRLDEATVKAEAMRLGLFSGRGELDASARAQAVLSLVMAGTTKMQGNFALTATGAANRTKILRAQLADAGATLGTQLLPHLITLVGHANNVVAAFSGLSAEQQKYILIAVGIVAALGPVLMILGSIITIAPAVGAAFTLMTGPVGIVIAILAALFIAYQTNFLGFADGVNASLAWVKQAFTDIQPSIQAVADLLSTAFTAALPTLTAAFDIMKTYVTDTISAVTTILDGFVTIVRGIMMIIKGIFTGDWGLIKEGITTVVSGIKKTIEGTFELIKTYIITVLKLIKLQFITAWSLISSVVTIAIETVSETVTGLVDTLTTFATDAYDTMVAAGTAIGQGLIDGIQGMWTSVVNFAGALADTIYDTMKGALNIFSPSKKTEFLGEMLGVGLMRGMDNSQRGVQFAAGNMASAAMPPVPASREMSGGSPTTVHNTININGYEKDKHALADEVFGIFTRSLTLREGT